jgi:hypothetical protein
MVLHTPTLLVGCNAMRIWDLIAFTAIKFVNMVMQRLGPCISQFGIPRTPSETNLRQGFGGASGRSRRMNCAIRIEKAIRGFLRYSCR